jgi:hypothetical protein
VFEGVLICESLRAGATVGATLTVTRIERVAQRDAVPPQPAHWTLLHFRVAADDAELLADELAQALDEPGWYADLRSDTTTYVVYPGRVFRYRRGDSGGRAEAVAYGRSAGVPDSQLDWPA